MEQKSSENKRSISDSHVVQAPSLETPGEGAEVLDKIPKTIHENNFVFMGVFTGRTGTGSLADTNTGIRNKELAAELTLLGQWPPPEQGFRKKVIEGSRGKMKGRKTEKNEKRKE